MASAVQYARWESQVEPPFWQALSDRKLDSMQLSEEPVQLAVPYRAATRSGDESAEGQGCMRFALTSDAFSAQELSSPDHVSILGDLIVTNTAGSFKSLDKSALLQRASQRIWDDICSGAALSDPSLLNRFVMLVYADLKTWSFYYWFCFPGITMPTANSVVPHMLEPPKLAGEFFGSQLSVLAHTIAERPADCRSQPVFTLALSGTVREGKTLNEPCVCSLATWNESELVAATADGRVFICVVDPCTLPHSPGWVVRNVLCLLAEKFAVTKASILCYKHDSSAGQMDHSLVLRVAVPALEQRGCLTPPKSVGWEMDTQGKPRPRKVDMGPVMDPRRLAESAVDLNLKLMRWRLMPSLQVSVLAQTKCLLLGAGTLGCQVSRSLLAWGVRKITFVDSGRVSFSNPVRQSLYDFEDCTKGGRPKAAAAAEQLRKIFPGVDAEGIELSIPMPGHPVPNSIAQQICNDVQQLEQLINDHDVVFLLTDTRESRWLPTLLAAEHGKLAMTVALGFDSFLVMRHGVSEQRYDPGPWHSPASRPVNTEPSCDDTVHLGCYFCNDVVAPANSMRDRTLDQQCTVTRPGLAAMSGALCVELLVNLCHHPDKALAPVETPDDSSSGSGQIASPLGTVPHQVRGFLADFSNMFLAAKAFDCCTACSQRVRGEYRRRRGDFVLEALQTPAYLEELTGLAELQRRVSEASVDEFAWDSAESD